MPSASKTHWSQLKVGLMAILALVILAYLLVLMTSSKGLFESTSEVYTYLDDSAALADGAPVTLNGINVGKVKHADLSGSSQPNREVKITLLIDNQFMSSIPVDSQASIAQPNLLGVRYINIKKGMRQETIKAGAEIQALDTKEIADVVAQGYTTLAALQGIVTKLDDIISQIQLGKGNIGKLLVDETLYNKVNAMVDEGQKLMVTLNSNKGTLGKLLQEDDLYNDFRSTIARFNTLIDGLNNGQGTAGKLLKDPALFDEARTTMADLRKTIDKVNNGPGDVAKLLNSDELHTEIKDTLTRLDGLLDKINNGGGTVSQLLNNPQLYESLDGTTRELQGLLKDFRSNPKKFLTIKLQLFEVRPANRKLVVNADDFGFTRDVNQGILEAHQSGILTATTLMATGAAFDNAVGLALVTPTLDIGCHLVLVGDPPFPRTVSQLMQAVALRRLAIYDELCTQVERILKAGLQPTHLDTHKHTHLLPPVLDAVARLSQEFRIPWVRRPFDIPMSTSKGIAWSTRAANRAFGMVRSRSSRVLKQHGCRSTDHFAGFQITGRYDASDLAALIRALPEGSTEFMCHPGRLTSELRSARTRLKESREQELRALTAPEVRAALSDANVVLCSYRDL